MAVAGSIDRDARVRKTAVSVKNLGYEVTLLWGARGAEETVHGDIDGVRTIGLPVRPLLQQHQAERTQRKQRSMGQRLGLTYVDQATKVAVATELEVARARLPLTPAPGLVARERLHRLRSRGVESIGKSVAAPRSQPESSTDRQNTSRNWRGVLASIADLETVFTPMMISLKPDILHIHDVHLLWGAANAKRALLHGGQKVSLIYDAHEYVAGQPSSVQFPARTRAGLESAAMDHVDAVITVSEMIAERLSNEYRLPVKPTVMLNVPRRLDLAIQCSRHLRRETGVGAATPLGVYSGVLGPSRNLPVVLQAVARVPGVHLAIVCVPSVTCAAAVELAKTAQDLGVNQRIHLLAPVAPEEIVSFVSSASFGLIPNTAGPVNHQLTLPNKLFEYLLAGLPVAASDLAATRQILTDWQVGCVFDPGDPATIAKGIEQVLRDHDGLAKATRQPDLVKTFMWEGQEAGLAQLYDSLTSPPGPANLIAAAGRKTGEEP